MTIIVINKTIKKKKKKKTKLNDQNTNENKFIFFVVYEDSAVKYGLLIILCSMVFIDDRKNFHYKVVINIPIHC